MQAADIALWTNDRSRIWGRSLIILRTCLLLSFVLLACSPQKGGDGAFELPTVAELEPGIWNSLSFENGAWDTVCADGSDYSFYAYPGNATKLVIDFQGGGACWNSSTCSRPRLPEPSTGGLTEGFYRPAVYGPPGDEGIYNKDKPENPIGDWSHLFISYCTADAHLGDAVQRYKTATGNRTIYHNGQNNVEAVLDWTFANFAAPEAILVTGCSAGAYVSLVYTPRIREHYPKADIYQLGDCGAGVLGDEFVDSEQGDLQRWNIEDAVSPFVLEPDIDIYSTNFFTDLYTVIAKAYADGEAATQLTQHNSVLDRVQIAFYALQSGVDPAIILSDNASEVVADYASAWTMIMQDSLANIEENTENFHSYISLLDDDNDLGTGTLHCIISRPEFYSYSDGTDGVAFVDWFADLVSGRPLVTVQSSESSKPSQVGEPRLY